MSSIRNSRTRLPRHPRTRLLGAAATVALAALSLTACGGDNGTGVRDEGAGKSASTTTSPSTAAPTATPSTVDGSSSTTTAPPEVPSASKPGADTVATSVPQAPSSGGKAVTCEGSNTRVVAAPLSRPLNHMLLTVTNVGHKTCFLYNYPALKFTGAQSVPPAIEDSHPQAVVTLNPGESGYASVSLSAGDGSGANGRTVKSLAVYFYGRSGNESVGAAARPSLPAKGVYIDDSLKTTYWEQSMDDALAW